MAYLQKIDIYRAMPGIERAPPQLRCAGEILTLALWLRRHEAWNDAIICIARFLSPEERRVLAFAVLESLPADDAFLVAEESVFGRPDP
ncbi:MAG: hypothetical protein AAF683_04115 [Pseudomonadota bacterium]